MDDPRHAAPARSGRARALARRAHGGIGPPAAGWLRSGFAFFLVGLCQGPPHGSKITLARPDRWIAGWRDVAPDAALAEVCRRYVAAFGPVRPVDFHEWFGTRSWRVTDARELFASLGFEQPEPAPPAASVRLLSEHDMYVMGFRDRYGW